MVMSKASKAIVASFLCLLFNAGGNVTNAMQDSNENINIISDTQNIDSCPQNNNNNIEITTLEKSGENNKKEISATSVTEKKEKTEVKAEEKKAAEEDKKNPEEEKSIWNILIPIFAGVGGLVVGTLVGKFVF